MPNRTVVRRSTSRISSAVSAFIEDALPFPLIDFPLRAVLKKKTRSTSPHESAACGRLPMSIIRSRARDLFSPKFKKNAVPRPTPSLGSSQHPAAAHVYHLPGYVFGFLGCEKRDSCRHIIHRRRPANRVTRVAQFPCFFEAQILLVDARWIHYVHSDPVFCLLERQGTRQRHHRRLRRRVSRNLRLSERAFRSHRPQVNDSAPPALAHQR